LVTIRQEEGSITPQPDNQDRFVFGRWRFDADAGDLSDGETTTRLEHQVAKLLHHFLINQNIVMSRDELMAAVWDNRIVSDDAINRCISILRQILSPEDKSAYIETVVRRGYVAHFPPAPVTEPPVAKPVQRRRFPILIAAAILPIVATVLFVVLAGYSTPEIQEFEGKDAPMVAVLPFSFDSHTGDSEFFADGMQNDLLTQLAKLQSLRVISNTSVQEYRAGARNLREIGEDLGADVILEGSVQIAAKRIHINAQLINARSDQHLWAETYDRELTPANIFEVQEEIALAISEATHTTLTQQDSQQLALIPTENMAAYRAYHRAMQIRDLDVFNVDTPEYLAALEEAVELDPTFTRAWAELVTTLAYLDFSGLEPEMTVRAEESLAQLQAVAPGSADLLFGQAAYVYYSLRDFDRAHKLISRAITMIPNDFAAMRLKSWIERRQGDYDAFIETRRELRRLDPRNPSLTYDLLDGLLMAHRYDEAWTEVETSPVESFSIEAIRRLLQFREHRSFPQLQESMQQLCEVYAEPDCGWDAFITNRNYSAALDSLDQSGVEINNEINNLLITDTDDLLVAETDQHLAYTHWLMGDDQFPMQKMEEMQDRVEYLKSDSNDFALSDTYIVAAMLAGMRGNVNEAEEWIERWERQDPIDWSERVTSRHKACRVLGMIEATHATVKCIRDGLKEPSLVMPFLEPYLPYYDSLRDKPEFIEMLAEIEENPESESVTWRSK